MTDFSSLDPEIRAYALVGQFLKRWSELEQQIHEAIGAALHLDETKRYILCANLQLRDKIHVLRALVQVSSFPTDEKEEIDKELVDIINYTKRNMVADADGVAFLPVKAKKSFARPLSLTPGRLPLVNWMSCFFEGPAQVVDGSFDPSDP